jgi:hypothetical protein
MRTQNINIKRILYKYRINLDSYKIIRRNYTSLTSFRISSTSIFEKINIKQYIFMLSHRILTVAQKYETKEFLNKGISELLQFLRFSGFSEEEYTYMKKRFLPLTQHLLTYFFSSKTFEKEFLENFYFRYDFFEPQEKLQLFFEKSLFEKAFLNYLQTENSVFDFKFFYGLNNANIEKNERAFFDEQNSHDQTGQIHSDAIIISIKRNNKLDFIDYSIAYKDVKTNSSSIRGRVVGKVNFLYDFEALMDYFQASINTINVKLVLKKTKTLKYKDIKGKKNIELNEEQLQFKNIIKIYNKQYQELIDLKEDLKKSTTTFERKDILFKFNKILFVTFVDFDTSFFFNLDADSTYSNEILILEYDIKHIFSKDMTINPLIKLQFIKKLQEMFPNLNLSHLEQILNIEF